MVLGFGAGATELRTVVEGFQMTAQGLRLLGRGEAASGGGETPALLVSVAAAAATGNPIGLILGGTAKGAGEATGSDTIEGAAKRTAKLIADELRVAFKKQGWI